MSEPKVTGRPRAAIPVNVDFRTRTTQGEHDALSQLVERWAEKRAESNGGVRSPGDGPTLWFRLLIREKAAAEGIAVVEPSELGPAMTPSAPPPPPLAPAPSAPVDKPAALEAAPRRRRPSEPEAPPPKRKAAPPARSTKGGKAAGKPSRTKR